MTWYVTRCPQPSMTFARPFGSPPTTWTEARSHGKSCAALAMAASRDMVVFAFGSSLSHAPCDVPSVASYSTRWRAWHSLESPVSLQS
jgi:hypothetical protein